MKIAITTDHTGLAYDNVYGQLRDFLRSLGHEVIDCGPTTLDMGDDYPDLIAPVAKGVASRQYEAAIIMGGSGQGEAMAANRVHGVRCTLFYGPVTPRQAVDAEGNSSTDPYEILKLSRQHNHANVLSLAARFLSIEEMKQAVQVWLDTPPDPAERHVRRVQKLDTF